MGVVEIRLVVMVGMVPGVAVVVVVLGSPGSQILKTQKLGSVTGADSAPTHTFRLYDVATKA